MTVALAAVEMRGISFAYPQGAPVLRDVNLHIQAGEIIAIVGPSGSGKTTLLKLLMRLLSPAAGTIRLRGEDLAAFRAEDLYRRIGMVFQNPAEQLFAPTVAHDVAFGPRNLGLDDAEVARRVDEALALVSARALGRRPVHQLSFGEQKRVCLAGVLAMAPTVLVLDEPTAGLDPPGEDALLALLVRLNRERAMTTVLATHAVDWLPTVADRVCVLHRGMIVRQGTPRQVFDDPAALAAVGMRLPILGRLFHDLGEDGLAAQPLPLTLAEARAQVLRWTGDAADRPARRTPS